MKILQQQRKEPGLRIGTPLQVRRYICTIYTEEYNTRSCSQDTWLPIHIRLKLQGSTLKWVIPWLHEAYNPREGSENTIKAFTDTRVLSVKSILESKTRPFLLFPINCQSDAHQFALIVFIVTRISIFFCLCVCTKENWYYFWRLWNVERILIVCGLCSSLLKVWWSWSD